MSNWLVIKNNEIFSGPSVWNAINLHKKVGQLGLNVSFPKNEVNGYISLSDGGIKILPQEIIIPTYNPNTHIVIDDPSISVEDVKVVYTYCVREKTQEELDVGPITMDDIERMMYENKYLEASKQLCELAGDNIPDGVWPKLEDIVYETKAQKASEVNPAQAQVLMVTLFYTLSTLKYDYQWQWEQIEHRIIPM